MSALIGESVVRPDFTRRFSWNASSPSVQPFTTAPLDSYLWIWDLARKKLTFKRLNVCINRKYCFRKITKNHIFRENDIKIIEVWQNKGFVKVRGVFRASRTSMKLFTKIFNGWKPLTIFTNISILDIRLGSERTPLKINANSFPNNESAALTHFLQLVPFYTPWKHEKTKGFLTFSEGTERNQRHEKG